MIDMICLGKDERSSRQEIEHAKRKWEIIRVKLELVNKHVASIPEKKLLGFIENNGD